MTTQQQSLWQRIQSHALDDPASSNPFSLRLAKENGWGPEFTRRAIEEYRRFVFLAVAAGHPVSPSDAVDQVWHLHLLYTRDYWDEFCGRVLEMPLHHGPSRGGAGEADKFGNWHAQTRASYRGFFGEPANDIWPEQPIHPATVRVDVARNWIVPKPSWKRWFVWRRAAEAATPIVSGAPRAMTSLVAIAVAVASVVLASPASAAIANYGWPLEMRGPEFLGFFVVFSVVTMTAAGIIRWRLRGPADVLRRENLDAYSIAQLAGGPARAFTAAVANAMHRGLVRVDKKRVIRESKALPGELPLLERGICDAARLDGTPLDNVRSAVSDILTHNRRGLEEAGLLMHGETGAKAHLVPFGLALFAPAIGAVKIAIGVSRDRPVAGLVVLSLMALAGALFFLKRPRRSRRGDAALQQLKDEHAALAKLRPDMLARGDIAMLLPVAVGLWGVSAVHGTPLESRLREVAPASSGEWSAGACGTSCGGGGSSGCGGGGGCGGCGGGGGGD